MGSGFEDRSVRHTHETRASRQSSARSAGAKQMVRHDLDGLIVLRNDAHRILVIDDIWVRLRPLDYQVVLPLLNAFNQPVSVERLCRDAFGSACSEAELKRLYHCIDRVRPHLAAFGLAITSLSKKRGYMLWRDDVSPDHEIGDGHEAYHC